MTNPIDYKKSVAQPEADFQFLYSFKTVSKNMDKKGFITQEISSGVPDETIKVQRLNEYTYMIEYVLKKPQLGFNRPAYKLIDGKVEISSSNVDAFNFVFLQTSRDIFSQLIKDGFDSPLIHYFADLEVQQKPLQHPLSHNVTIKTTPFTVSGDVLGTTYIIAGGFENFQLFLEYDDEFFSTLLRAIKEEPKKYGLSRIDLCVDLKQEISHIVLDDVKKYRFNTFGKVPYVYGKNQLGDKLETSVPKRSKKEQHLRSPIQEMAVLDSFYSGSLRTNTSLALFYNKQNQMFEKFQSVWPYGTRIEVRGFFAQKQKAASLLSTDDVQAIIESYKTHEGPDGAQLRSRFFLMMLSKNVQFLETRSRKITAPWYLFHVLRPLSLFVTFTGDPTVIKKRECKKKKQKTR